MLHERSYIDTLGGLGTDLLAGVPPDRTILGKVSLCSADGALHEKWKRLIVKCGY